MRVLYLVNIARVDRRPGERGEGQGCAQKVLYREAQPRGPKPYPFITIFGRERNTPTSFSFKIVPLSNDSRKTASFLVESVRSKVTLE